MIWESAGEKFVDFAENALTDDSDDIQAFSWVDGDGKCIHTESYVCIGCLNQDDEWPYRDEYEEEGEEENKSPLLNTKYLLVNHNSSDISSTKEESLEWIDYLVNRSPWAEAFLSKDASTIFGRYFVIDATIPANYLASAAIATRFDFEVGNTFSKAVENFHFFKKHMDENRALLMAHMVKIEEGRIKSFYPVMHNILHPRDFYPDMLRNFERGVYNTDSGPYNEVLGYRYTDRIWVGTNRGKDSNGGWVDGILYKFSKDGSPDLNIFSDYHSSEKSVKLDNLHLLIKEWENYVKEEAYA